MYSVFAAAAGRCRRAARAVCPRGSRFGRACFGAGWGFERGCVLRLVLRGGRGSLLLLRLLPLANEARDFQRNPLKRPTMRELEAVLTAERL